MSDDVGSFVDGLVKEAGNTDKPAAQAKAPANKSAPNPADHAAGDAGAAPAGGEHFDDGEYADEEEGGEAFDHAKVDAARKAKWPKKYANAMSRRDKDNTELRAKVAAYEQRFSQLQGNQQQPPGAADAGRPGEEAGKQSATPAKTAAMWELESKKPLLDNFKDWGEFSDAMLDWKLQVKELSREEAKSAAAAKTGEETITPEQKAAIAQNEARVVQQAKEIIEKNPEVYQLMQQNADLIDSLPQPIINVIGSLQNPVVAMMELVQYPGALEALRHLSPAQAAQVLFNAQAQGLAKANGQAAGDEGEDGDGQSEDGQGQQAQVKKVSGAPQPIKAAKSSPSGKRALHQMNADEIFKELGL